MEMSDPRQFAFPHDLSVQCSDKILMQINRPDNFQQTIDLSVEDLSLGRHTDVTLVPEDGGKVKVHGFLLSAASPFLRSVLCSTFSPSLEYVVVLPGVRSTVLSCLAQLLYGATVVTCQDSLAQLTGLVDQLGISLSLVSQPAVLTDQTEQREEMEETEETEETEEMEDSSVAMLKYDDKNNIPSSVPGTEETVETVGELPLCCYHCSLPFSSFDSLNAHICQSAATGRRHHRCNQCGAVLSSMWRLRQHLATHSLTWGRGKADHMYGRSSRRVQSKRHQAGDHGYAGASGDHRYHAPQSSSTTTNITASLPTNISTTSNPSNMTTSTSIPTNINTSIPSNMTNTTTITNPSITPPSSRVHSEHSYGTKRDSSPEGSETKVERDYTRSDHIYFADVERDEEETDTDNEGTVNPLGQDHEYFSSPERERSSPRFRKLLPKSSTIKVESTDSLLVWKFSCSSCQKSFPQAYRLRRHVREVHDKEKMHQCDKCDKKFFKTSSLNRHKVSVHNKIRPFSCTDCEKKFKDKSALKYHIKRSVCFFQK